MRFICGFVPLLFSVLFSVTLPFFAISTHAEHSDVLGNINYYPHWHRLLLTPRVTTTLSDSLESQNEVTSQQTGDSTTNLTQGRLTVTYGLLPGFRLGVEETELFSSTTNHTNGAGVTTQTSSSGASDPAFITAYRYFDDDALTRLSADVALTGSPSVITHNSATTSQNGNEGRGYGTLSLSLPVFWWHARNEIELSPAITRDFNGNSQGGTPGSSTFRDANYTSSVTLSDRIHLWQKFYVQAGGVFNFPYSVHTVTQSAAATSRTTQYPFYVVPRANLGWLIRPDILFDAEYDYYDYTTTVAETSNASANVESTVSFRFFVEL